MNIVGFTNLVVLALIIVGVYPVLKIQLLRIIGKGIAASLLSVFISITLLKLATNLVEKTFVSYGVDFEAKERKPTREEMKHRERIHHESMKGGKTEVNMVGTDEYKTLSGGRSAEQEQTALSNNQVLSMMETNETMNEMIGEGFGMRRQEGFAYGGSKEGLFHMGGKKNKKSKCDCGCNCPNCRK